MATIFLELFRNYHLIFFDIFHVQNFEGLNDVFSLEIF